MGLVEGGEVDRAPEPVHGKAAEVELAADPLFEGLPRVMRAARYHSLLITRLPPSLVAVAITREGERELVMAVRHRELPWVGVQFHPESYLTPGGAPLLDRVLAYARAVRGVSPAVAPS